MKYRWFSRQLASWYFYEWAISPFSAVIMTFVFSAYFTQKIATNPIIGTEQWGFAISLSAIIIAILSPILGAIADNHGSKKPWLAFFTVWIVIGCFCLWFAKAEVTYLYFALLSVVIANVGSETAMVFYNSLMRDLVTKDKIGRLSGIGWAFGYFGGLVALCICLFVLVANHLPFFELDASQYKNVRIVGPFIALWVALFSLPIFFFTPDSPNNSVSKWRAVVKGFVDLKSTLFYFKQHKEIGKFLLARLLYIDGLNTIFAFGGIYAAETFAMSFHSIILFGIGMNIAAGIGALIFSAIDDKIGSRRTVIISLFAAIICVSLIVFVRTSMLFWIFGLALSIFVGPIQSASRSFMLHLSPKEKLTEMFGFYNMSGKITAFLGPMLLGWVTALFNSQRVGVSTILVFLLGGVILLLWVNESNKAY